jgi:hypothetical protein
MSNNELLLPFEGTSCLHGDVQFLVKDCESLRPGKRKLGCMISSIPLTATSVERYKVR